MLLCLADQTSTRTSTSCDLLFVHQVQSCVCLAYDEGRGEEFSQGGKFAQGEGNSRMPLPSVPLYASLEIVGVVKMLYAG